jgi:hypothetical protein
VLFGLGCDSRSALESKVGLGEAPAVIERLDEQGAVVPDVLHLLIPFKKCRLASARTLKEDRTSFKK